MFEKEWLNYADETGPLLRVGIFADSVEQAIELAEGYANGEYAWYDVTDWGYEVVFEKGYIGEYRF
jgi:hypothetical protein